MSIYFPVIFVSVLFYAIGYFINKENSKYLLSGYNTMSNEEREKFDIEGYLKIFKPFLLGIKKFYNKLFIVIN